MGGDDLFVAHHPYAVYALPRARLDPDTPRVVATWFIGGVVVVETAMAGVAFIPARLASTLSIAVALGMWLSTGDLYDRGGSRYRNRAGRADPRCRRASRDRRSTRTMSFVTVILVIVATRWSPGTDVAGPQASRAVPARQRRV